MARSLRPQSLNLTRVPVQNAPFLAPPLRSRVQFMVAFVLFIGGMLATAIVISYVRSAPTTEPAVQDSAVPTLAPPSKSADTPAEALAPR